MSKRITSRDFLGIISRYGINNIYKFPSSVLRYIDNLGRKDGITINHFFRYFSDYIQIKSKINWKIYAAIECITHEIFVPEDVRLELPKNFKEFIEELDNYDNFYMTGSYALGTDVGSSDIDFIIAPYQDSDIYSRRDFIIDRASFYLGKIDEDFITKEIEFVNKDTGEVDMISMSIYNYDINGNEFGVDFSIVTQLNNKNQKVIEGIKDGKNILSERPELKVIIRYLKRILKTQCLTGHRIGFLESSFLIQVCNINYSPEVDGVKSKLSIGQRLIYHLKAIAYAPPDIIFNRVRKHHLFPSRKTNWRNYRRLLMEVVNSDTPFEKVIFAENYFHEYSLVISISNIPGQSLLTNIRTKLGRFLSNISENDYIIYCNCENQRDGSCYVMINPQYDSEESLWRKLESIFEATIENFSINIIKSSELHFL